MLKNIKGLKVLYKGEEIELKSKNIGTYKYVTELRGINGEVVGYQVWNQGDYSISSDMVAHIDTKNIENSWSSDTNITFKVVEHHVNSTTPQCKQGVILNYTPHTVNIIDQMENKIQDFPSKGEARCQQTTTQAGTIGNIPITSTTFGEVIGLPEEKENTYYIVSRLIRQALPERQDLLVPNEMVRDDVGRIIGCKSLANN